MDASDMDVSDMDASDMDASDMDVSDMDASDMDVSDMDVSDMDVSDMDVSWDELWQISGAWRSNTVQSCCYSTVGVAAMWRRMVGADVECEYGERS